MVPSGSMRRDVCIRIASGGFGIWYVFIIFIPTEVPCGAPQDTQLPLGEQALQADDPNIDSHCYDVNE